MRLIIVRHAETTENLEGIFMGQTGGHLTEQGKEQARLVAQALKDEKIDAVYTSDLARAKDTALEIMKYHPDVKLVDEKLLRERTFGNLEGKHTRDFFHKMTDKGFREFRPEGGETAKEMGKRIIRFYETVLKERENETVLFVTHAGNIQELLLYIFGWGEEKYIEINPGNTAITILEIDKEGNYKIEKMNFMEHLKK